MAKASATADENRPFSGPPPSAADARGIGNVLFSLETARAALLQLRDSVTSAEFLKLMEGVADASETEAKEDDTASERSETSVSDGEMDISSSGGSTVRELNAQLMAGEENTGSVSIDSVVSGNTHPIDNNGEWSTVTRRLKRKKAVPVTSVSLAV